MKFNSFCHTIALSLTVITAIPLAAFSAQSTRYNSDANGRTVIALNSLPSSVTHSKSKVMINLAAAQRPNFSGKWVLDTKASDPVDEILKEQGVSWLERQAAKSIKITQDIRQDPYKVTVVFGTGNKTKTEVFPLDGSVQVSQGDRFGTVKTKTMWSPDGMTLITISESTSSSQTFKTLKLSRKIQDQGKTMFQLVEMQLKNGKVLKANRVFRKAA